MTELKTSSRPLTRRERLSAADLDRIGLRLSAIEQEDEFLRKQLREQIEEYGSRPPKSDKSQRLESEHFQFTLTSATSTEIHDGEVERIREACPESLFVKLFTAFTKYKLAPGAHALLAGTLPKEAPRNLRQLFQQAVLVKESTPRLRVEPKT